MTQLHVCPAAFEVTMTEYDVAPSERSLQEYANGLIDILSYNRPPKDSYEYGLRVGSYILIYDNSPNKINPLIMVQALEDFLLQRPLLIPRDQAESMMEENREFFT
ncbi:MAG: hypothetical protein IJ527_00905 [Prevotella sp.]|nr:hypothetical protein [Prevotella sp.]